MFEIMESQALQWDHMNLLIQKDRMPQSLLLVGPRHVNLLQFVNRLMALQICEAQTPPCGLCRACHLLMEGIHPDIRYIRKETPSSAIKIEQIRELQQNIFQTPQRGTQRFIVLEAADKMNTAAANALLKILEEPPVHTQFILIAEQVSSIPATILSRCQKYNFPSLAHESAGYLTTGRAYPEESTRAALMLRSSSILLDLCELIEEKTSPCTIAARLAVDTLDDILWLLYLITAEAIHCQLIKRSADLDKDSPLISFSRLVKPFDLIKQLDKINAITSKLNHNINMNQTLVLESLLLGYLSVTQTTDTL